MRESSPDCEVIFPICLDQLIALWPNWDAERPRRPYLEQVAPEIVDGTATLFPDDREVVYQLRDLLSLNPLAGVGLDGVGRFLVGSRRA